MAYGDALPLGSKIIAAMQEAAAYFGNPAATPTSQQLALAIDFAHGGSVTNQYVTLACLRDGLGDASTYAAVSGKVAALEPELMKLFFPSVSTPSIQVPHASNLQVFTDNAAAVAGHLGIGDLYRTGADPDVVCVVH